jgi:hypothetical protein
VISKVQPEKKEREAKFPFPTEIDYFVLLHSPHDANSKKSFSREENNSAKESLKVFIGKSQKAKENPSNVQNLRELEEEEEDVLKAQKQSDFGYFFSTLKL